MRLTVITLVLFAFACVSTTSVTRTGTGLFAPREKADDEDAAVPRGLTLTVASNVNGMVTLDLRNYSMEPFVFAGTPEKPRLIVEVQTAQAHSKHTISPWTRTKTHELPAGERVQLKIDLGPTSGRVRIGLRSQDFGYTVWTGWMAL